MSKQSGFSTMISKWVLYYNYIHSIRQIIEGNNEFEIPPCTAFIDNEKAFDSIALLVLIETLRKSDINSGYIQMIANIYEETPAMF